ncbi:hypothetical protein FHW69_001570 [Luteibacter sp. Sphag1AF]|uniref:CPBP family intramembrane glutamic endopeptidase n=1 Tax=Luteibacter sp. Sphag1AF TaxID=2587031 RepID=UPI0016174D7C|nr:CPBP family intramembrane glutamic endopeptidase [Luteibacter sp. Sphag1AF]MBB3226969.1 hypothetical protein [Luteibacter sp. Sphag1AF]
MSVIRAGRALLPWIIAAAILWLLPLLAARVVSHELVAQSERETAAYDSDSSPWAWSFRRPEDLVASRAFGGGRLDRVHGSLKVTAVADTPVEVGFPMSRPADIVDLSRLRLDVTAPPATPMTLLVREHLNTPAVTATLPANVTAQRPFEVSLGKLPWKDDAGHDVASPKRAAMLRLVLNLPKGGSADLHAAALLPLSPLRATPVALPARGSAEALLQWRDLIWAGDPSARLGSMPLHGREPRGPVLDWLILAIYASALVVLTLRPVRGRGGQIVEALAAVAGPLWLIAGMRLGPVAVLPAGICFLCGLGFGVGLAIRRRLPEWHWLGSARAMALPLLAVPAATLVVAAFGHALAWPAPGRALLYVAWALLQQWLMLAVTAALLDRLVPRAWAVLAVATLFALLHTPNGLLMQMCFVAELGWAWCFLRYRALGPIALAHAASAVLLQAGLAGGILRSLEVSARFLN